MDIINKTAESLLSAVLFIAATLAVGIHLTAAI